VAQALGDAARRDGPQVAATYVPITNLPEPTQSKSEVIAVLTLKEAALRLGISTSEVEAMVASGKVRSLMAGWPVMIPSTEIERLASLRH
jgi:excisionase family DNA binding protein